MYIDSQGETRKFDFVRLAGIFLIVIAVLVAVRLVDDAFNHQAQSTEGYAKYGAIRCIDGVCHPLADGEILKTITIREESR